MEPKRLGSAPPPPAGSLFASPWMNGVMLAGVAVLMVSRLPTFAFKRLKVPGRHVVFVLLAVGAFAAFLISTPWVTLGMTGIAYLASIPYAHRAYQRRRRLGDALGESVSQDENEPDEAEPDEAEPDEAEPEEAEPQPGAPEEGKSQEAGPRSEGVDDGRPETKRP